MKQQRRAEPGEGSVWLVLDRSTGGYVCYWYAGANEGRMVEQARAASAADAVAWGRERSPRVRIRTDDARSSWAGAGPTPDGYELTWSAPVAAPAEGSAA